MSRSTQPEIKEKPCKKFLKWVNVRETEMFKDQEIKVLKNGQFIYWDKEAEDNVVAELPLKFAVLENDVISYKGYSNIENAFLYTNEVRSRYDFKSKGLSKLDMDNEVVVQNSKTKEVIFKFKLKDVDSPVVKGQLDAHGLKKIQSVYVAMLNEAGEWEIQNLQLLKSQLTGVPKSKDEEDKQLGWWKFVKNSKSQLYSNYVEIKKYVAKKSEFGNYTIPVYSLGEKIDAAVNQILKDKDTELQEYLNWYFQKPPEEEEVDEEMVEDYPSDWDSVKDHD